MKEAKLLVILAAIVLVGGGALLWLGKVNNGPEAPPRPTPPPVAWNEDRLNALVRDASHVKGDASAPVTIVEFADFQCPACRRAYNSLLKKTVEKPGIRFVFHHYPFADMHPRAMPAAVAAEAAAKQGKFWPMYENLFTGEKTELTDQYIEECAKKSGCDIEKFKADIKDPSLARLVEADKALGDKNYITSTPTFIVRDSQGKITQVVGGKDLEAMLRTLKL
jgi:protein-disulfide isomerase